MPNVDPFVWAKRWRGGKRGQEERTIRGAEAVEPGAQVGFAYPGFRHEFVKPERAADGAAFPIDFRQRPERLLDRQFLSRALRKNLVGVTRQRVGHASDRVIGRPREMARAL